MNSLIFLNLASLAIKRVLDTLFTCTDTLEYDEFIYSVYACQVSSARDAKESQSRSCPALVEFTVSAERGRPLRQP